MRAKRVSWKLQGVKSITDRRWHRSLCGPDNQRPQSSQDPVRTKPGTAALQVCVDTAAAEMWGPHPRAFLDDPSSQAARPGVGWQDSLKPTNPCDKWHEPLGLGIHSGCSQRELNPAGKFQTRKWLIYVNLNWEITGFNSLPDSNQVTFSTVEKSRRSRLEIKALREQGNYTFEIV